MKIAVLQRLFIKIPSVKRCSNNTIFTIVLKFYFKYSRRGGGSNFILNIPGGESSNFILNIPWLMMSMYEVL